MGALHAGHMRLIERARRIADEMATGVVVTVFVNPTQFNQKADFERYPRDLDADLSMALSAGADAVYAPAVEEVYPPGESIPTGELPAVATAPGLEDRFRPGHFAGVQQVVRRLFALTQARAACFGEKDWQQLALIRAMVGSEGLGVRIEAVPTERESDGLAMSSRNVLLSLQGRLAASAIPHALQAVERVGTPEEGEARMQEVLGASDLRVEYAVIRDPLSLGEMSTAGEARALIAAWADGVRLIDNAAVHVAEQQGFEVD